VGRDRLDGVVGVALKAVLTAVGSPANAVVALPGGIGAEADLGRGAIRPWLGLRRDATESKSSKKSSGIPPWPVHHTELGERVMGKSNIGPKIVAFSGLMLIAAATAFALIPEVQTYILWYTWAYAAIFLAFWCGVILVVGSVAWYFAVKRH